MRHLLTKFRFVSNYFKEMEFSLNLSVFCMSIFLLQKSVNFCFWHFAGFLQISRAPVSSRSTRVHFSNFACSVAKSFPILRAIFLAFNTWARLLVILLVGSLWCLSAAFCLWCYDKFGLDNFWFYNLFSSEFGNRSGEILILSKIVCNLGDKIFWLVAAT